MANPNYLVGLATMSDRTGYIDIATIRIVVCILVGHIDIVVITLDIIDSIDSKVIDIIQYFATRDVHK
jgi:hypothetical protein